MNIQKAIEEYGVTKVARASGFPVSTIHRWCQANKIPGKGKAKEFRERELRAALATLKALDDGK